MNFLIPEHPHLSFGTLFCIGRNYAKHIEEMNSKPADKPVVFLKPRSSLLFTNQPIILPPSSENIHHEVEMVLLIGKKCRSVPVTSANEMIEAVAAGIDVTARDIQTDAKKNGLPWALSKGFDTFAPVGNFAKISNQDDIQHFDLSVTVNGEIRQSGNTSNMLFSTAEIISYLSEQFTLYPGDIIFTGTPEGVSRIKPGDRIEAKLGNNLSTLSVHVSS
ncbi:MAG: fumarylacetoacetate hydrolase family protein [Balneolaceae bacterium]|nr:fumarylacetoacetate hydrolase family protein [Balneolaceae bacterium]